MHSKHKKPQLRRKKWVQRVNTQSNALDLEPNVFKASSARKIAQSLKRSAERSTRRKTDPFRSAMSMLNFFINRAGKALKIPQRKKLEDAKKELRHIFHRPSVSR